MVSKSTFTQYQNELISAIRKRINEKLRLKILSGESEFIVVGKDEDGIKKGIIPLLWDTMTVHLK